MKRIVLTGGGTAGHVTPNLALVPGLRDRGYEISYIGSYDGMEKDLVVKEGIPYTGISTGMFRRYLSAKNLTDPFRVLKGVSEAKKILKETAPDIVFSKGGFVSVPVVYAAHSLKIPVIIHESDITPGLANKLCIPYAAAVCHSFKETAQYLPEKKRIYSGSPVRKELLTGDISRGMSFCGFNSLKPVIMIMGGSLGSVNVNQAVRAALSELLKTFQIVHLCGKGKTDPAFDGIAGYRQFEYISAELKDLFAMADLVISRSGANAIFEYLTLKKPNVLIPLGSAASRGDQILNARAFTSQGYSEMIPEEELTSDLLVSTVKKVWENKDSYIQAMTKGQPKDSVELILDLIDHKGVLKDSQDD